MSSQKNHHHALSVLIEYNWTSSRDMIADVTATCEPDTSDLLIGSVLASLQQMGFDLDPDYRISYFKPSQKLYLYLGKVVDLQGSTTLLREALSENTLTLLVREPATSRTSGSASKNCSPFVTPLYSVLQIEHLISIAMLFGEANLDYCSSLLMGVLEVSQRRLLVLSMPPERLGAK
jgi:hypothetical protein